MCPLGVPPDRTCWKIGGRVVKRFKVEFTPGYNEDGCFLLFEFHEKLRDYISVARFQSLNDAEEAIEKVKEFPKYYD